jgi:hypothetical protein
MGVNYRCYYHPLIVWSEGGGGGLGVGGSFDQVYLPFGMVDCAR